MPHGAELHENGVRFRLWAPGETRVSIEIDGREAVHMARQPDGWHELITIGAHPGSLYRFVVSNGLRVPDPASRFQPQDVHGPSEVIDPAAYDWQDNGWRGRPWPEAVVYEIHVGAFTPEGTFRAAIDKLDHLVRLGVTAVEIMPISDFPGARNWGYDGVMPYAPDSAYGRPEDLKALVDAAHARGISVLLDVVYNHFGPDGNYLPVYAPLFFTDRHKSPWGAGINFDGDASRPVRDFVVHNALYWIEEFHLDGLRLDAVHAIQDDSDRHVLVELAETVRALVTDRPVHLILENEDNRASLLDRDDQGRAALYSAQWNDDVHHVLHTAATGESVAYYEAYVGDTELLGRSLAEGFAFQGQMMPYSGKPRGEASGGLPPSAFVAFSQNHDQIGNRAFGQRLNALASAEAVRAVSAVYLLLPQVPMIFMGEEFGARQPFLFFVDFEGELAEKVRDGRREEFSRFPEFSDPEKRETIPDPVAEETFLASKLRWEEADDAMIGWFTRALGVRREVGQALRSARSGEYRIVAPSAVEVQWPVGEAGWLRLQANLSDVQVEGFGKPAGRVFWREGEDGEGGAFGPWAVRWSQAEA
ncbi:MAG: malto-oligosyltrehalose trehalohydrolase [Proteobacteria bacterium]|nr:malto-oligosyltrehalose trehalohydrolase [Pseudomonadota bacterium]